MFSPVFDDVYEDLAAGRITKSEVQELEKMADLLKEANPFTDALNRAASSEAGKEVLRTLLFGLAGGLGAGAAGLTGSAAYSGAKKLYDKATFGRDMKRILDAYPHLKRYPESELRLAYTSMRHLNPHFAKDTIVGGTILGQMLRSRDPESPSSLRMDMSMAGEMMKSRAREDDPNLPALRNAFQQGMMTAITEGGKARNEKEKSKRSWENALKTEALKRELSFFDPQRTVREYDEETMRFHPKTRSGISEPDREYQTGKLREYLKDQWNLD